MHLIVFFRNAGVSGKRGRIALKVLRRYFINKMAVNKRNKMDRTVDKQKIQSAVRDILVAIGENPDREGLKDTPDRVARMFEEITAGYDESVTGHLSKTFEGGGSAIVEGRRIEVFSTCEDHLMPFFGEGEIGHDPNGKKGGCVKPAGGV